MYSILLRRQSTLFRLPRLATLVTFSRELVVSLYLGYFSLLQHLLSSLSRVSAQVPGPVPVQSESAESSHLGTCVQTKMFLAQRPTAFLEKYRPRLLLPKTAPATQPRVRYHLAIVFIQLTAITALLYIISISNRCSIRCLN
jgi:hypothetical protein